MELKKANILDCQFKEIEGYNGNYLISPHGFVYSKIHKRLLNNNIKPNRYRYVVLSEGNTTKKVYTHRLVAMYYIENTYNKPCVNHKDGNKANNRADNLEWCTHKENNNHAFAIGLNPNRLGILNK
jgi:hypothetical protein